MIISNFFIQRFRDITLKQKLFLCILIFIILPLLLSGIYINASFTRLFMEKSCETNFLNLKQTYQGFVSLNKEIDSFSLEILSDDRVQWLMKNYGSPGSNKDQMMIGLSYWLKYKLEYRPHVHSVSLSNDGRILLQTDNALLKEEDNLISKALELKGKGFWTYAYYPETYDPSNKYIISFYRAVNDFDFRGRPLGVERISITEDALCELYEEVNTYKDGKIFLINHAGRVVSSPYKEMISQELGNEAYVNKVLNKREGFFTEKIEGENHIILHYIIMETGWHLIHMLPEKAFNPMRSTVNAIIFVAILLCLVFGVLFSIVQNLFILKPLKQLFSQMGKLGTGNFSLEFPVKSNDEIGKISKGVIELAKQLKELINSVYISKIKQKEAEFKALEAQINPHFLYNTLDSIHWLAVKNMDYDVSEQIEALSDIFRHVLSAGLDTVTIQEEINFLQNYMLIQNSKFGDRIETLIDIDEGLLDYKTPKLILQPLVENSINHGLEKKTDGGKISVHIYKEGGIIRFTVVDNGLGTDENRIREMLDSKEQSHNVFALKNIDDRIKTKYGEEYGLKFFSEEDNGTRVEVIIPAVHRGDDIETADS